jgi:hypothetical protein
MVVNIRTQANACIQTDSIPKVRVAESARSLAGNDMGSAVSTSGLSGRVAPDFFRPGMCECRPAARKSAMPGPRPTLRIGT